MAIEFGNKRESNPEIFQRYIRVCEDGESYMAARFGVKDGLKILIPAEYNFIQQCDEYGFIGRKGAYYYAFNQDGVMFVKEAPGIEAFGKKGVLVYEEARRENPTIVPWQF